MLQDSTRFRRVDHQRQFRPIHCRSADRGLILQEGFSACAGVREKGGDVRNGVVAVAPAPTCVGAFPWGIMVLPGVSATDAATIPRPQTPYSTPAFLLMLPRHWGGIVQWGRVVVAARLLFVWSDWRQSS